MKIELNLGRSEILTLAMLIGTAILAYKMGAARADGPPDANALTYSGVLEQANGTAFTGTHSVQLQIWKDAAGAQPACAAPAPTPMDLGTTGHFQVTLSAECQEAFKSQKDLWTEVFVDGNTTGKSKVGAVPYALEAGHAVSATNAVNAQKLSCGDQTHMLAGVAACKALYPNSSTFAVCAGNGDYPVSVCQSKIPSATLLNWWSFNYYTCPTPDACVDYSLSPGNGSSNAVVGGDGAIICCGF